MSLFLVALLGCCWAVALLVAVGYYLTESLLPVAVKEVANRVDVVPRTILASPPAEVWLLWSSLPQWGCLLPFASHASAKWIAFPLCLLFVVVVVVVVVVVSCHLWS